MGAAAHLDITGAKGGDSKPKTPVEAPDSLQSTNIAKILLAVGEGEFDGTPTDRDIYLDNTPIMDDSGNVNFPGVKWEWRPGSVEQDYIQGIPAVENETSVGVELRSDNPFTRALSNPQLSAFKVRMSWDRLFSQDSSGNTNGYRIEYAIDVSADGGAYVEAHRGAVDGKTMNGYQRSQRVDLPKSASGWQFRVRRITPNQNQTTIGDTMMIAGYTEIIDEKLRYPNTALLYIEFDAQQFQNIPAVTVDCKAKRWPVPSNYDPIGRTYTGVWDGTFKQAWTNNPAFVTYGLCVEDRFGLGKRIKSWMVDKWEMYRIAQYCDQSVPNGVGGMEPRFLCDMNLQGRAEAWTLLRDLSAIYRGMVYWAHGALYMQADMPRAQDIDYVFTRANVIDGDFVYGGAERSTHYSRALVSYDNPANNYDTDVIPVTDLALQRRYRDRPIEISAIGCTRASEAQRRGKWALLSNNQDRTVTFKTGMEGRIPLPGFVIPVADELVAGRPNGGRISSAAGRVVTLDRDTPIKAGDRLILNLPNGTAQARTVESVNGRAVTVTTAYGVQPEPELQWAIDYEDLAVQLFRVLKTTRTQQGEYEITALEFNPSKFAAIDTGAKLDERPISVIPVTTVQPPANVTLTSTHMIDQGIAVNTMTIAWPAVEGAVAYDVEWRKDNGNWIRLQRTGAASVDVTGIYAGAYLARVRAVSAFDITSIWKSSILTQLTGKEGLPPAVTSLTAESLLFGIGLKWTFPPGAEDTQRTELWYSEGTDLTQATKLADLAYPQAEHTLQGLRGGQRFFFWARLVDRSGNIGPWFPADGTVVSGVASMDAGPILEQITGEILESHLGKELTEKIELIDGNGPGSVNERVGTAKTELAKQVADVNTALTQAKNDLQGQIADTDELVVQVRDDAASARQNLQQQITQIGNRTDAMPYKPAQPYTAGQVALWTDGKIYQATKAVPANTPPPNANYWMDVGQAVVTANGLASRVQTVETTVGTLDGKLTAQAGQITNLQSSLTTTNGNVTAAQQAAEAASALAGGKGKVIVQNAAPAAADRSPQNLWIDTTNSANTPKRWNGSAWVAVTDKVATDAAAAAASALSQVATKAEAAALNSLTTRVTQTEQGLTTQGQSITGLTNSLTVTNSNVTAAQAAADAANTLAGGKGKVLVQPTTPVVADRLAQNLWIDTTNNANTPKRWNGTAWVAVTDKVATDAAAAAASALSQVAAKADAAAVNSLTTRVGQTETGLATQGQAITGLTNNLTTTNGNVTTAQQAAQAASDKAGAKGEVIYGTSQPVTDKRLAQNLWIDTTGNTNTPKRWSGSAWVAVTDKVATDAAAAAASALAQVATKAEASAVNSLTTRVAQTETGLTTQGQSITDLKNSVANKADSTALQTLSSRVTATEGKNASQDQQISSQSSAITSLNDSVSKKADASTVQSMGNTVSQQGQTLAAQGQSLTRIDAALPLLSGENLLPNSSFEDPASSGRPKHWVVTGSAARSLVPSPLTSSVNALRVSASIAAGAYVEVVSTADDGRARVKVTGGSAYTLSVYARGGAPGLMRMYIQFLDAAGAVLSAPWTVDGFPLTETFGRYVLTGTAPAAATQANIYAARLFNTGTAAASLWMEIDNAQLQEGTVATAYQPSVLAASEVSAEATSALSARVDKNEQGITSTSTQVTQLGGKLDTTNQNVTNAQQAAQAASDAAGAKGKVLYQSSTPAVADRLTQNLWIDTTGNANTPKRWNGSAWSAVTDKVATDAAAAAQDALTKVATKAEASTVQVLSNAVSQHGQQITADGQAITRIDASMANIGGENLFYNPSFDVASASNANVADGWGWRKTAAPVVTSTLRSSDLGADGKAQRLDITGLSAGTGTDYVDFVPQNNVRPSIYPGAIGTASVHVRGNTGLMVQVYAQFKDAAGNTLATSGPGSFNLTPAYQRISYTTGIAPADTVRVDILFRIRSGAGSSLTAGFVDFDMAQFEQGSVMSGWKDNGKTNAAATEANASATAALGGRVSTGEAGLTSVSNQLTQLDNSIGDIGGENLFYNPAFAKYASLNGAADGWSLEGSVTTVDTLVDSWLNSGEKAQRVVGSGFTASTGSGYKSLRPQGADPDRRPAVAPGQTVTASVHGRGTVGLSVRIFLQWINAAGAVISAPASALLPITAAGDRKQFSGVAPAEAAKLYVYYRIYSSTGAVTSGNAELARPQLEYGARMTGWRDNGQVNAASNAATSAVVDGLTSAVNQQGGTLSSVAGRTTTLENSLSTTNQNVTTAQNAAQNAYNLADAKGKVIVQSSAPSTINQQIQNLWIDTTNNANTPKRWSGSAWVAVTDKAATDAAAAAQSALTQVATKAEASALQTLTNRVAAAEGVNTSQSESLIDLKNNVGAIQSSLGASGLDPAPGSLWQFETTTEGWAGGNATLAVSNGVLTVTPTTPDPQLISSGSGLTLSIAGAQYTRVRAAITRRAGAASVWTGTLYYATASHGFAAEYRNVAANPNLAVGQSTVVEWDMASPTTGGDDWVKSVIGRLRFNFANDLASVFDIHWIAVGRVGPSASSRVVESLTSTVTQQGDKLTAEAQRIDGLYTSVGNASAAIQNEATARTNADSALSQQIQNTQSSLGSTNVSLQQLSTAHASLDGKVNGTYTVKLQAVAGGQYVAAGFGLGLVNQGGMFQTTFAVYADRFAVLNAAGNGFVSPFAIQGGQVFMNDAFIRDASITNAKIADASISRAKIEDAAINAAKIGVAEVDTLRIRGNAVTVPVSSNNPTLVYGKGENQWVDLIAVGVQMDEAGYILAQYGCYQGFGGGTRKYHFRMEINGQLLAQGGGDWADGFPNLLGSIGVGPGYFVITIKWWGENNGVGVQNHTLYAMGTKR